MRTWRSASDPPVLPRGPEARGRRAVRRGNPPGSSSAFLAAGRGDGRAVQSPPGAWAPPQGGLPRLPQAHGSTPPLPCRRAQSARLPTSAPSDAPVARRTGLRLGPARLARPVAGLFLGLPGVWRGLIPFGSRQRHPRRWRPLNFGDWAAARRFVMRVMRGRPVLPTAREQRKARSPCGAPRARGAASALPCCACGGSGCIGGGAVKVRGGESRWCRGDERSGVKMSALL
jgi:hypothetical protein